MNEIRLRASSAVLLLTTDERDWCRVVLIESGSSTSLGAEKFAHFVNRLVHFLENEATQERWVLSLSEEHVSFYGTSSSATTILRLQDADGEFFTSLTLTPTEKEAWVEALKAR